MRTRISADVSDYVENSSNAITKYAFDN
jgi:hypothetical protein